MKRSLLIKILFLVGIILILFVLFNHNEGFDQRNFDSRTIPLNLFQTWETKELPPKMSKLTETVQQENPEFNYQLFDASERAEFIRTHFEPDVLDAYETLVPGAYKADLWRYCVLYIHGGIYMDIKVKPMNGFRLIDVVDKEYFVKDRYPVGYAGIWNGFMVCSPGNEICWKAIRQIVENVRNEFYGDSPLATTGPLLLKNFFTDEEIGALPVEFNDDLAVMDKRTNRIVLQYDNEVYEEQYKGTQNKKYYDLWLSKSVFKK